MKKQKSLNITSTLTGTYIKIYFNNILHLSIDRTKLFGVQSWIDERDWNIIELYTKDGEILLEYDSRDKWIGVLTVLDQSL